MKAEDYRRQYNIMVTDINKKLKALAKNDPESITLERYRNVFRKVSTKKPNFNTIRKMYTSAKNLLESGALSLEAQERSIANAIDTLHREGYEFINRSNFNSFMRFLDDARARGLGSLYSSTQLLETFNEAKKKGLTKAQILKNIERWTAEANRDSNGKLIEVDNKVKLKIKK